MAADFGKKESEYRANCAKMEASVAELQGFGVRAAAAVQDSDAREAGVRVIKYSTDVTKYRT